MRRRTSSGVAEHAQDEIQSIASARMRAVRSRSRPEHPVITCELVERDSSLPAEPLEERDRHGALVTTGVFTVQRRVTPEPEPAPPAAPELKIIHEPQCAASNQYRILRFRVESDPEARVVAVTSSRSREGGTVTAFNLALALAEGGRQRVVLCDLDMRGRGASRLAGREGARGLSELVAERRKNRGVADIAVYPVTSCVAILPAGAPPANCPEVLGSWELQVIVGELRQVFDYVILDVPAVLDYSDACLVHTVVDRYILCVRSAVATIEMLQKALARLPTRKVLGTALIGAPTAD